MGMYTMGLTAGEGKYRLQASATVTPRGITVTACSPDFAHIGATAQAIPRPEPGRTATVSILAVPCHRDEIPARDIAAALATRFKMPCVASTGFHVEHAGKDDIDRMLATTQELIAALEPRVTEVLRAGWDDDDRVNVVDEQGNVLGTADRIEAHRGEGILHQAFSIFLIEGEGPAARLLLCRRSGLKRLWGGVLADTCAGHPHAGEALARAAARRLQEECGVSPDDAPLAQVGRIVYREDHGDGNCEREWCAVFGGRVQPGALHASDAEVSEIRAVPFAELDGYLAGLPEHLAPWVEIALGDAGIRKALEALCV